MIKEPSLSFLNINNKKLQDNIWSELNNGLWRNFKLENYIYNNSLSSDNIEFNKPLFDNYQQIIPGIKWNSVTNTIEKKLYFPKYSTNTSITKLLEISEKYFYNLKANRIGVHLSGGFDSGLIIALLKKLRIPFVPIGLKSDTFEFRTERIIQEIMINWGEDGLLINLEDYPYYSDIDKIPAHQIPDSYIKSFGCSSVLARAFKDRHCDVVLTGQGGDTLFVDEIKSINTISYNIENEFLFPPEEERIYRPMGIKLESFFSNPEIIDLISSLRIGQNVIL